MSAVVHAVDGEACQVEPVGEVIVAARVFRQAVDNNDGGFGLRHSVVLVVDLGMLGAGGGEVAL